MGPIYLNGLATKKDDKSRLFASETVRESEPRFARQKIRFLRSPWRKPFQARRAAGLSGSDLSKWISNKKRRQKPSFFVGEVTDAMSELFFMDSISSEVGMVIGVSSKVISS